MLDVDSAEPLGARVGADVDVEASRRTREMTRLHVGC